MYLCVYIYIYIFIYIYICMYEIIFVCIYAYMCIRMAMYARRKDLAYAYTCIYHIHQYMHTAQTQYMKLSCTRAPSEDGPLTLGMHTYTHTITNTHIHKNHPGSIHEAALPTCTQRRWPLDIGYARRRCGTQCGQS